MQRQLAQVLVVDGKQVKGPDAEAVSVVAKEGAEVGQPVRVACGEFCIDDSGAAREEEERGLDLREAAGEVVAALRVEGSLSFIRGSERASRTQKFSS